MAFSTWLNRALQAVYLLLQTPRLALAVLLSRARGDGHAGLALKWLMAVNAVTPEMILKLGRDGEVSKVFQIMTPCKVSLKLTASLIQCNPLN